MASFTPEHSRSVDVPKMTVLSDYQVPGFFPDRSLQVVWHHATRKVLIMVRSGSSRDPVAQWNGKSFSFNHWEDRSGWKPSTEIPGAEGPNWDASALRLVTYFGAGCIFPMPGEDPLWADIIESCPGLAEAAAVMFE